MSEASAMPAPARKVRPYFWSVRREIWENPAIWIAPLAVMAVVMAAFLFSLGDLPKQLRIATIPAEAAASAVREDAAQARRAAVAIRAFGQPALQANAKPGSWATLTPAQKAAKQQARSRMWLNMPFSAASGVLFVTAWLVMIFYCLGALHNERRDRSILFWKSLPVSDATTVMAKATLPLLIQPLVILPIILAGQLLMLGIESLTFAANGLSIAQAWPFLHLPTIWMMTPYGLLVNTLWDAPIYGWLFMVSGWARKNTFVWAVAPPLALALFEGLTFHTTHVLALLQDRIFGGYGLAFDNPHTGKPVATFADAGIGHLLTSPGLWGGLAVAAGFFAVAVWLRRTRDPI